MAAMTGESQLTQSTPRKTRGRREGPISSSINLVYNVSECFTKYYIHAHVHISKVACSALQPGAGPWGGSSC